MYTHHFQEEYQQVLNFIDKEPEESWNELKVVKDECGGKKPCQN